MVQSTISTIIKPTDAAKSVDVVNGVKVITKISNNGEVICADK